jgi:8-oxo-dGTP pyrophosphatase MutT (NUDIX family)
LKEETNLTPSKMFIADHVSSFYEKHGDRINFVPVFGIEVDSMDVTLSDEHCEYKWVELDEALSYLVWEGQKKGIKTVHDMVFSGDERMKWSQIDLT